MKYRIARASNTEWKEPQPCKGASEETETSKAFGDRGVWYVGIDTLADLQKIVVDNGPIILRKDSIQIYDSYVE